MIKFPIYSPEEELHLPLFEEKKVQVFIKRDDMIHPFISGNKWRKLKHNIIEVQKQNKKHLVSFGGIWSNHLLATACAAAHFGLKSTAFVRGEDIANDSVFMYRLYGMDLIFTDRQRYRDKKALFADHFADDSDAYFVNEGGAGKLGARGCAEIIDELEHSYDQIFCAAGTGTTAAGLLTGIMRKQPQARLHVIAVLKGAGFLSEEISKYSEGLTNFDLHTDYHFGGYAKYNDELLYLVRDFVSATGILIDQVYTGKMIFALMDMIRNDKFKPGSRILAVHTGGTFGILGVKEKLYDLLR